MTERRERVRVIFAEALNRRGEERAAYLLQACGGDEELHRDVISLLGAIDNAGGFLAEPTLRTSDLAAASTTVAPSAPLSEGPGSVLGVYKLLQRIGEGGFGAVFLAEQERPVRRKVAVKIIKPGMDSKQVIGRFEAERQALALMDHPHIARVFDGGLTDSQRPYFVMEYVIGDPITQFAEARKLSLRDRLLLFQQVCQAVQHAHQKGIIHRDLKPGNVLVNMIDGRPYAKVIDFGIAKATGAAGGRLSDVTFFTEHRQLIGTPEYMSPEQAEGSPDIDTRTDVYALGVLLYELLTGLTPFDRKRLRSAAFAEMQRIIKEEEPIAPSVRVQKEPATKRRSERAAEGGSAEASPSQPSSLVRSVASSLPARALRGELDWIVLKALEKDRARRYESASQIAADIERHLTGEPVVAAPPSIGYRVAKFVRRHRGAVVSTSAVVCALLVGIFGMIWQAGLAARAERRAIQSEQQRIETEQNALRSREWDAYIAGLQLAQSAMGAGDWPSVRRHLASCPEALRGFEWKLLNEEAAAVVYETRGGMRIVGFDDDTRILIAKPSDQVSACYRIDATTGAELGPSMPCTFAGGTPRFSADRTCVVTRDDGGGATFIDTVECKLIGDRLPPEGYRIVKEVSPDSRRALLESASGLLQLWDVSKNEVIGRSFEVQALIESFLSPTGTRLLTVAGDEILQLWDCGSGNTLGEPGRLGHGLWHAEFNAMGSRLLTLTKDGLARLWDADDARQIGSALPHCDYLPPRFLPDGLRFITHSEGPDGELRCELHDAGDSTTVGTVPDANVSRLDFRGDGLRFVGADTRRFFAGSPKTEALGAYVYPVSILETVTARPVASPRACRDVVQSAKFNRRGDRILLSIGYVGPESDQVIVTDNFGACRYELSEDENARSLERSAVVAGAQPTADRAISPDGTRRVQVSGDGVWFRDGTTDREILRVPVDGTPRALQFSGDGSRLLIVTERWEFAWDARPAAQRNADAAARWDARETTRAWTDELWDSALSREDVKSRIVTASQRTPLERLGALDALRVRFARVEARGREWVRGLVDVGLAVNSGGSVREDILGPRLLDALDAVALARGSPRWGSLERRLREQIREFLMHPAVLDAVAWNIVRRPDAKLADEAAVLAQAAVALWPDDPDIVDTLGVAQYRAGQCAAAIDTLRRSHDLYSGSNKTPPPHQLLIEAMARFKLGMVDLARSQLEVARMQIANQQLANQEEPPGEELLSFLREAEALIERAAGTPPPAIKPAP